MIGVVQLLEDLNQMPRNSLFVPLFFILFSPLRIVLDRLSRFIPCTLNDSVFLCRAALSPL